MAYIVSSVLTLLAIYGFYRLLQVGKRDPRMPKGPPTIPILGNLHQIPPTGLYKKSIKPHLRNGNMLTHLRFREWGKQYGGVFSLKFGPTNVIVLCDRKAVHDLVDKKGLNYADRPHSYVGHLITQGDHMVLSSNDPITREKRKVATHNLAVSESPIDLIHSTNEVMKPRVLDDKLIHIQEAEYV
jgi:hypothetical protein